MNVTEIKLRRALAFNGLRMKDLIEKSGYSRVHIHRLIHGRSRSEKARYRIEEILGTQIFERKDLE